MKISEENYNTLKGTLGELKNELNRPIQDKLTKECLANLTCILAEICAKVILEDAVVTDNLTLRIKP